ncbi:MAG: flagellar basal-body MS-ring/collar protein FliF [Woeseiaceae bacterium]|nr:flagellar basal-body MS-ring/collar protein FliF [Woeseiaceae bacterium]
MDNTNVIEGTATPVNNMSLGTVLQIPAVRQILLLIGVAGAVAGGFAIAMWSQSPNFTQLYGDMEPGEVADVSDALRSAAIEFKLDPKTGGVLVPESSVHTARMQLASQGLTGGAAMGMDMLGEKSSFGTSQFMETARYQHALEAELGRTIASLGAVREARVHLALPKQSSFIRDQKMASASVLVHLFRGRALEADQAAAVVNMVAASVPNLQAKNVTVVDQAGNLLSSSGQQMADAQANSQFKYTRRLEETYKARIEDLLTPLLGAGRIRAEVVADIDFTYVEETRETFDPNRSVVRSEKIDEDRRTASGFASGGVPGAQTNQPPEATGQDPQVLAQEDAEQLNTSRSSIRNYEVDRTISLTRPGSGSIRKLSVAVIVDESPVGEGADAVPRTLTDDDLNRYTALVREAVGFNEARGDTVVVIGEEFQRPPAAEAAEPPAFWEKPGLKDAAKQAVGAALVLAIAFGIVRPMLRSVVTPAQPNPISGEYLGGGGGGVPMPQATAQLSPGAAQIPPPSYDEKVAAAKNITGHDPARVAQVVKQWVAGDV